MTMNGLISNGDDNGMSNSNAMQQEHSGRYKTNGYSSSDNNFVTTTAISLHSSSSSLSSRSSMQQRRPTSSLSPSNDDDDNNDEKQHHHLPRSRSVDNNNTKNITGISHSRILRSSSSSSKSTKSPSPLSSLSFNKRLRIALAIGLAMLIFMQVRQIANVSFLDSATLNNEQDYTSLVNDDGALTTSRDRLMDLPRGLWQKQLKQYQNRHGQQNQKHHSQEQHHERHHENFSGRTNDNNLSFIQEQKLVPQNNDNEPNSNVSNSLQEWKRARALSNARAHRRRIRTKPPTSTILADPIITVDPTIDGNYGSTALDNTTPPRLTLDLPSHRSLIEQSPIETDNNSFWGMFSNIITMNSLRGNPQSQQPPSSSSSICGTHAQTASTFHPHHYPSHANINSKSKIVITSALSQLGISLILHLQTHCHPHSILGIDAAYPNTRHDRITLVEERYKYLQRRVPGFKLEVPFFGISPHPKGEGKAEDWIFDVVKEYEPTHVVHLGGWEEGRGEFVEYGDVEGVSPFADNDGGGGQGAGQAGQQRQRQQRGMMRRFSSLLSMDQILSSLARFNDAEGSGSRSSSGSGAVGEVAPQPQLVYITSNEAEHRSGVISSNNRATTSTTTSANIRRRRQEQQPASVYGTSCLLNEVLASYYHHHHNVHSVGLRIPTVFGPYSRPGSLLHDLTERTVRNAVVGENVVGKDDNMVGLPRYPRRDGDRYDLDNLWKRRDGAAEGVLEEVVYVSDVAEAIVAAMQFKQDLEDPSANDLSNGPALFRIGSEIRTSMQDMKKEMERHLPPADKQEASLPASLFQGDNRNPNPILVDDDPGLTIYDVKRNRDLLGWTHRTDLREGMESMLAWHILKAYPFGLPPTVPSYSSFQSLLDNSHDRGSLYHHSLPCASGCQWDSTICSTSAWDVVVDTANEITKTCKYVIYTVDLRPELDKIRESAPSDRNGWEDMFCKIAFVSSSSKLAESIYADEWKEKKTPMNVWNGKGVASHWNVVALPGTQYTMPEVERSLAKLTPTNLFHDGVEKALFVDHRRAMVSTDQAIGVMQQMKMKERTTPKKRTISDNNAKMKEVVTIPPRKNRRSVFLTNKYSIVRKKDNTAKNLARFVLTNTGTATTQGILAQTDFYARTAHLVRTNTQRSDNYQEFFQDNFFEFDFLVSLWLVHELQSAEGRNLRCEMYEEHSLWGNAEMEDMSMGYVLARRKVNMKFGKMAENQYEGNQQWYPLLVPRVLGDNSDAVNEGPVYLDYLESAQDVATDSDGVEYYITFLPQKQNK